MSPGRSRNWHAVYERRNRQAREGYVDREGQWVPGGWTSYSQRRYWLQDRRHPGGRGWSPDVARSLADAIDEAHGWDHGADRDGSLMSARVNELVNRRDEARPGDWRARLVRAYEQRPKTRSKATTNERKQT